MIWRCWNWLSGAMLPLAMAVLRVCWLWPWLELARTWLAPTYQGALLPVPLIAGLPLGGMAMARWATTNLKGFRSPLSLWRARLVVAGGGLAIIALVLWWQFYHTQYRLWDVRWAGALSLELVHWDNAVPPPLITLLAVAYLWLRGMLDGRRPLLHDDIWGAFTTGFIALVLFIVAATTERDRPPAGIDRLVLLFFVAGMAALALSSLEAARGPGQPAQMQVKLNRYWLISILFVIAGLLGLGLALSALIAPEDVARALDWMGVILNMLGRLLYTLLSILTYLLFLILYPLVLALVSLAQWLWALLGAVLPLSPPQMPELEHMLERMSKGAMTVPEELRWVGLIGLLLLIGLAFALALQRFQIGVEEGIEETREVIFSSNLLRDQLSALWRRWLRRLHGLIPVISNPFLSLEDEIHTRRAIRAIYQALLAAARGRGWPRRRSQTPIEYRHELGDELTDARDALETITDGYMQARYAWTSPSMAQVERVRRAWEQIQTAIRQ